MNKLSPPNRQETSLKASGIRFKITLILTDLKFHIKLCFPETEMGKGWARGWM